METSNNQHYHHVLKIQATFRDHAWSRQQTRHDSAFIAEIEKELQEIANEAYELGNENRR